MRYLRNAVLLIVLSLLCLILIELVSRLFVPAPLSAYGFIRASQNKKLHFELVPNTKTIFRGTYIKLPATTVKISEAGFRGNSIYPAAENNYEPVRIAIIGDSVAFGWGVELEDTFAKKLETRLNQRFTEKKYEVINFSVPGYNITQKLELLKTSALKYHPGIIIINVLPKDFYPGHHYEPSKSFVYALSKMSYLVRYFYTMFAMHKRDPGVPRNGTKEALHGILEIKTLAKQNKFSVLIALDEVKPWMNEFILECGKLGFSILDYSHIYNRLGARLKGDGHPSKAGHSYIAEEIFEQLMISFPIGK